MDRCDLHARPCGPVASSARPDAAFRRPAGLEVVPDRTCVDSTRNVDRVDLALPIATTAAERHAQIVLERAIALLVAARALYNLANAPGPVPFEASPRPCPPAPTASPSPEVVRLTKVFAPPPIEARSLLSIFA